MSPLATTPASASGAEFLAALEAKVLEQLSSQRVGYLLGAGSSHLNGSGYPLAGDLWGLIKSKIPDATRCAHIQDKLDGGVGGLERALDLLDDGGAADTPYRHLVTTALAELFMPMSPPLDTHVAFVRRLAMRADPWTKVFSLNYDPLLERAAARARVRVVDGFLGAEESYFDAAVFEERIGRIRGTHRGRQLEETVRPLHLLKLHGSLGWYECPTHGVRRCGFAVNPPSGAKRLMVPPQRRKATETMLPPYAAIWSEFRACLSQSARPLHRLVCLGYGFTDEHVNAVIEAALARVDFTVLILTRALCDEAWARWSARHNVVVVTEARSSLKGEKGIGHPDLWSMERVSKEA